MGDTIKKENENVEQLIPGKVSGKERVRKEIEEATLKLLFELRKRKIDKDFTANDVNEITKSIDNLVRILIFMD